MRFTLRQFSLALSVVSAIAIAVTITVTASRPAAASSGIAEPAAVAAPAVPDSNFVAGAARRGACPLTCDPDRETGLCTKVLLTHCDGLDASACANNQPICIPPNAANAHIDQEGSNAGHENDFCEIVSGENCTLTFPTTR